MDLPGDNHPDLRPASIWPCHTVHRTSGRRNRDVFESSVDLGAVGIPDRRPHRSCPAPSSSRRAWPLAHSSGTEATTMYTPRGPNPIPHSQRERPEPSRIRRRGKAVALLRSRGPGGHPGREGRRVGRFPPSRRSGRCPSRSRAAPTHAVPRFSFLGVPHRGVRVTLSTGAYSSVPPTGAATYYASEGRASTPAPAGCIGAFLPFLEENSGKRGSRRALDDQTCLR